MQSLPRSIEFSSLYNPDLAPTDARHRHLGHVQLRRALGLDVGQHPDLHAGGEPDPGRDELEAGGIYRVSGELHCAGADAAEFASRGAIWNSLSGAGAGFVWSAGANVAAVLRALVACGWFGIQTWIGGEAINVLLATVWPAWKSVPHGAAICFLAFWVINLAVILKGIEYIRFLQGISAPILLGLGLLLLAWAYAGGRLWADALGAFALYQLSGISQVSDSGFERDSGILGDGVAEHSGFFSFCAQPAGADRRAGAGLAYHHDLLFVGGDAVTSATVVIYGTAIWDPVQLLSRFHSRLAVVISLIAILLATLNVNIGANVVSPANDFSNLWPRMISFKTGGVITCFMGMAIMPWKLLDNYKTFIFGWLGGYAAFLGPVAGIMICDYCVIRKRSCWSMTFIFVAELTNIPAALTGWRWQHCFSGPGSRLWGW